MASTRSLRILIVSERFHPEEFRINDLARDWVARGHRVEVLTQVPSYPRGELPPGWVNRPVAAEAWEGLRIRRVRTVTGYAASLRRKLWNYLSFALRGSLAALAHGGRPDVVFSYNTGPLTSVLPAVVLARWRRVPLVIWTQDLWPDSVWAYGFRRTPLREALLNGFVRGCYRPARRVLVSCAGFRAALAPHLPAGLPVDFVPNWAETLAEAEPDPRLAEPGCLQLTFAGNLGKVQNLDRVLSAFAALPAPVRATLRLNFVGDGSHAAALRKRVEVEAIPGVRFWGRVPAAAMPALYAASDGLLVPLDDQPIFHLTVPAKFQTCLAAGRPILAIAGGELQRLVEQEGLGLTAPPGDVEGIRRTLEAFTRLDPAERRAMGGRGRALLRRDYDRQDLLDRLNLVLQQAAGRA
ncbi:MAG: glycosyltransferase family 4 protein [Candidatus Delongbacteria bacterium]